MISYYASSYVKAAVYKNDGSWLTGFGISSGTNGATSDTNAISMPVFKGMKVQLVSVTSKGGESFVFIPYTY